MAWVGAAKGLLALFGLSARDDVVERNNRAAGFALASGLVGLTLCFAGGNVGDGPGWWVVVFSGLLSTSFFFLLWLALERWTRLADVVTIDRDEAAGVRLSGFFVAVGLILGGAVAGDWRSVEAALGDFFRIGWPALGVLAVAALLAKQSTPALERSTGSMIAQGLVPFVTYLAMAAMTLIWHAPWT
jgi:hypothetical protein